MSISPPFKLASFAVTATGRAVPALSEPECGGHRDEVVDDVPAPGRMRLADLNPHLHCSVLGTCLSTAELRKLMARFIDVHEASDLDVHHEAVRLTSEDARIAKALHKALDKRHEAVVQRYARTRGIRELGALWDDALRSGEVPGSYWAVLTHRDVSADLRQRVFGDVHMLSHLVGAANRADIRRLVALEKENAELRDRIERQQLRSQQLLEERDAALERSERHAADEAAQRGQVVETPGPIGIDADGHAKEHENSQAQAEALASLVAVQTVRRERAEAEAAAASMDAQRLQRELDRTREQARILTHELAAAEAQLRTRGSGDAEGESANALTPQLKGRRILYVGGRPRSTTAIRDLVQSQGGQFQKHDGGLEDRKGLLEASVAWAEFVLFPVDCIDHDSAGRLKRLCSKLGTPFVPLRSASVASFAAAASALDDTRSLGDEARRPPTCLRHA